MSDDFSKTAAASREPLITVGMPVYNGERFVAASIKSVLDQTEGDFELIITDNASSDQTETICREFAASDKRIRYHRNAQNIGAAGNYNLLLEMARAPFFRWSNADDLLAPTLHERCLAALQSNPDAVLAYGQTILIDDADQELRRYDDGLDIRQELASERLPLFLDRVGLTNVIYGLMRTEAVRRTHVFGDGTLPAADTAFMAELILQGGFIEVPEPLFYRRMHEDSSSHDRADTERQTQFWRGSAGEFRMPVLRQNMRFLRMIWRLNDKVSEKLRLSVHVLRRLLWRRNAVVAELVGSLKRN